MVDSIATWREALETGGVTARDRVLLSLPLVWTSAADCSAALKIIGAASLANERPSLADVDRLAPTVLISTPTEALRLAYEAARQAVELADRVLRLVVVTGEPGGSIAATRRAIEQRWGARCLDVYALPELGAIGWGCDTRSGIHLNDGTHTMEAIDPASDRPVADGELGELVVTTSGDGGGPVNRRRTGDLVRIIRKRCACGRSSAWAEGGVLGRLSERMTVRGRELLPSTFEQIVRRHPAVVDFHLRVYQRRDGSEVAVQLETDDSIASEGDRARVAAEVGEDLKRSLGFRLPCDVVAPGRLSVDQDTGRRARRLSRQ